MTQKTGHQETARDKQQNGTNGSQAQAAKIAAPEVKTPASKVPEAQESVKAGAEKAPSQPKSTTHAGNEQPSEKPVTVDLTQNAPSHNPLADMDWQTKGAEISEATKDQWDTLRQGVETGAQKLMQAAGQKSGGWTEFQDVRELQRWSALVGGGLLALFGLRRSLGSLTIMGVGVGLIYYAFTGRSPLQKLGTNGNNQGNTGTSTLDSNRPLTVKNILVKAPLAKVYAAWADFENFPRFMQHIKSVAKTGERTSHWSMEGPLHTRLEWDAETTRLEENKRIAWSSTNGDLKTSGQVTFNALPDGQVEVTVMLRYIPPAGVAGDLFARLFADPENKLSEDLRNFKRYIENEG